MGKVLFGSDRPLERAENIKTVFDAYDGEKEFIQFENDRHHPMIQSGEFSLLVTDEFPTETPGKAIMIGHSIDGGKTYGLDQPYSHLKRRDVKLMDYYVTSGHGAVCFTGSGLPQNKILPLGTPRTDAYVGKHKGDGNTILSLFRSYLYVPTFRRGMIEPALPSIDFEWLDNNLSDEELFVVKYHPSLRPRPIGVYKHIIEISPDHPSTPYLIDCDVVITDYSAIMFDGLLLNKPSVLFEKNRGYTELRGMYMEYPEEYSSRYCTNEYTLLSMIRDANQLSETERICVRRVADMCDGHATDRVLELIYSVLND